MSKPIFDILLSPREWAVLKALHSVGVNATARTVHEAIEGSRRTFIIETTHQILQRLVRCKLVVRKNVMIAGPTGPEHRVLWEVSEDGKIFFS